MLPPGDGRGASICYGIPEQGPMCRFMMSKKWAIKQWRSDVVQKAAIQVRKSIKNSGPLWRNALITSASSGIGAALARNLAI